MALSQDVTAGIEEVLAPAWNVIQGTVVPNSEGVVLKNGAVNLDATYLYADMANSTALAQKYTREVTAKVIRCYLNAASRIIRARGGEIRSFDGDRVMGIFIGKSKNTSAVKAALNLSWAVEEVIQPKLQAKWSDFTWKMSHGVGIDTGEALLVRGGVRGNNDLVSVGRAPNVAAKLSEERTSKRLFITSSVYNNMHDEVKYASGINMWSNLGSKSFGGNALTYYGSAYRWAP